MKILKIRKIKNNSDRYDIQTSKNHNFFANGILVHNSWCCSAVLPKGHGKPEKGSIIVSSKGLFSRGLALDPTSENNKRNIYLRVARFFNMEERIRNVFGETISHKEMPVYVLGEVFGKGIQDLNYGANSGHDDMLGFRVFDIFVGFPNSGRFLNHDELHEACKAMELPRVPVLYEGPFDKDVLLELTSGTETVSGAGKHLREGVVVRPQIEREAVFDGDIQRVQFKSVSEAYLMRKGNTTEYQ